MPTPSLGEVTRRLEVVERATVPRGEYLANEKTTELAIKTIADAVKDMRDSQRFIARSLFLMVLGLIGEGLAVAFAILSRPT